MGCAQQILIAEGVSTKTYATWDSSKKGTSITLSNGDLTASYTARGIVLSTIGKSSGKWYWEIKLNSGTVNNCGIGIAPAPITYTNNYLGSGDGGMGYYANALWRPGGTTYGVSFTVNDVIGVALDMDAGTLVFYKNNVSQGTAITGLTGTYFAGICDITTETGSIIANFGATSLTYTPPSGYNAGLYT